MAKKKEAERLKPWQERVVAADKVYRKWEDTYACDLLEQYYLGHQWEKAGTPDPRLSGYHNEDPYTINMVFPSIEVRKPSLLFQRPRYRVEPRPPRLDEIGTVEERAKLREDTLNTVVSDKKYKFENITGRCVHESHFRFGVVEVGYSANYIDNPNAGKPILKEEEDIPVRDRDGKEVLEPDQIPESEMVIIRRIPARQFRVSVNANNELAECDWCGYYEWHYLEDIKRNPRYKTKSLGAKSTFRLKNEYTGELEGVSDGDKQKQRDMVKLWKIWDIRAKRKHVFLDGHDSFLIEDEPFKFLPFEDLKFHEILDEWYPLPPVYNWISPQDELNETREMQRAHRRRFYRRYIYADGAIDEPELEKLETGGDGVYGRANSPNLDQVIKPVQDAPLDSAVVRNVPLTKQDFIEISGVSGESRQVAESETATQANIINSRALIRENYGRYQVADWLGRIGMLILQTIEEYTNLPFWIERNVDVLSPQAINEATRIAQSWQEITADMLGDLSYDVSVDIESLSPLAEESERRAWTQVLTVLANPQLLFALTQSDVLLRKTLGYYGIRSEKEIQEIKRVGTLLIQMVQQQQQQAAGEPGQATDTNTPEQVQAQLRAQMGAM